MTKWNQRIVCIVALVAMLATMFCGFSVSAEETEPAEVRMITEKEEELLLYLGILKTPGPVQEAEITRGGLAQIASRVPKLPEYTEGETYFVDVPSTHKYYKEIHALAKAGILAGDGNGYFRPDDPVTPTEISKVFLVILGYDVMGYYEDYLTIANRIDLNEGIEWSGNVTVGQMLRMICNALDTEMVEKVLYGEEDEYKQVDGFTALERYHGLVKQYGIVSGAYGTRLTDPDGLLEKNHLIINDTLFYYEDPSLLGKAVIFYSERDKATGKTKPEIQFLYENAERTKSITVVGEDVVGINGTKFEYYEGSNKRSVTLVDAPDVIVNGIAYPEYTQADLKPFCGKVTLINNNADNRYDVILVEEYTFMMIDSIDQEEGILYGKYPKVSVGTKGQEEDYRVIMDAGIEGELGFLIPGDMVAIQTSKNTTGNRRITVTYLGEGTTGVIEGIHNDIYTISGVQYQVTDATAMDSTPYIIGQTVAVYTHEGYCAGMIHADNDAYKFGYLIDFANVGTYYNEKLAVRIVNQDRVLMELTATDKLTMDEMIFDDFEAEKTWLTAAADKRDYSENLKDAVENGSSSTSAVLGQLCQMEVLTQLEEGETNFPYSQPVRYRLNNDGLLTHLDTLNEGANETQESLMAYQQDDTAARDGLYHSATAEMEGVMYNTQDRSFYSTTSTTLTDGKLYATLMSTGNVIRPPYNKRDETKWYGTGNLVETYYVAEAYTVNNYKMARYAVVYNKTYEANVSEDNNFYVIGNVERVLGEDGTVVRQVTLYGSGGPYTRTVADDIPDSQLVIGDIVQFQADGENVVVAMENYYSVAEGDPTVRVRQMGSSGGRPWGERYRMAYGTAMAYVDDLIVHTTSVGKDIWRQENLRNYRISATSFYRYTEESGTPKVETASAGDLVPYDTDNQTTQRVVMITYNGRLDVVYIIDKD